MATPANHDGIEGAEDGIRWFCTTAGATTPMEQVPINPLPDQVHPRSYKYGMGVVDGPADVFAG